MSRYSASREAALSIAAQDALRRVEAAVNGLELAKREREVAVRAAHAAGVPLRRLGRVLGSRSLARTYVERGVSAHE